MNDPKEIRRNWRRGVLRFKIARALLVIYFVCLGLLALAIAFFVVRVF